MLKIRNGKTVEVLNTDAEGRLILADALSLAVEDEPDAIVDAATLTGACMVALGDKVAGLMTNRDGWGDQVRAAADRAGEPVWPLPLPKAYRKQIESEIADVKNIGGSYGGALTAGLFLEEFVGDVPVGAPRHRRPGPRQGRRRRARAGRHRLRCAHLRRGREQLQEAREDLGAAAPRTRRARSPQGAPSRRDRSDRKLSGRRCCRRRGRRGACRGRRTRRSRSARRPRRTPGTSGRAGP